MYLFTFGRTLHTAAVAARTFTLGSAHYQAPSRIVSLGMDSRLQAGLNRIPDMRFLLLQTFFNTLDVQSGSIGGPRFVPFVFVSEDNAKEWYE